MRTKRYYAISLVLFGICIICSSILNGAESPQVDNNMVLVKVNPTLTGMESLVLVEVHLTYPDIREYEPSDMEKYEIASMHLGLEKTVSDKLNKAGIKAFLQSGSSYMGKSKGHYLGVRIDMLKLNKEDLYVFHIQTSLETHYLPKDSLPNKQVKINVWKSDPIMKAVPQENKQSTITKLVMEQIETFIRAYLVANPSVKQALRN